MKRAAVSLVFIVGCRFELPNAPDASGDSGMDGELCTPWNTRGGHVRDVCTMAPPGDAWRITTIGAVYDAEADLYSDGPSPRSALIAQPGNRMVRVVSVRELVVEENASLRVVGRYPLVVLSWSTIMVAGTIDVSSRAGLSPGAGGSREDCDVGDPGVGTSEAGGGGGGGLGDGGRPGGNGNQGAGVNMGGTPGGSTARPVATVLGGCRGGDGGGDAGSGGRGGDGGGAVQLTAKESISLTSTGRVHAGGMGGAGANGNGGGGGGGSGGFIGLDAPLVTTATNSVLAANGGAGGAGCESGTGPRGQDGPAMNLVALGGMGSMCANGADGGNGGKRGDAAQPGMNSAFSGGGGGGGGGYILIWTPSFPTGSPGLRTPPEVHIGSIEP
ncbi:MAG TPA: hypothetical protein VK932_22820 [Kofleriaceae bacterium]|nr:hypothetical protein [Kofleriaceae bacterium]